jgi:hypothetical protein
MTGFGFGKGPPLTAEHQAVHEIRADETLALRARIAELEARINYIEAHVEGLVRTHSQFAAAAEGSWSGKKQRVRAAEASQILAFIRKEKSTTRAALEKK